MKTRRSNGEGSIVLRGDGRWMFSLDLGKDEAGKRQRRYIYARSRAELLRNIEDERNRGGGTIREPARGTVGELVERWLQNDVKQNRAPNTFAQYESMWRVHAASVLAAVPLERFDVRHVDRLYASLRKAGVSSAVSQRVGVVVARAINVAIRRGEYFQANPFAMVEKPRHRAKEAKVLTIAQARRFLDAARGDRFEALWVLLLTSGLRLSEALGLEWGDLNLEAGTISVRQAAVEVKGPIQIGALKTKGSKRMVQIGPLAKAALRRHQVASEREGCGSRFVFTVPERGKKGAAPAWSHPRRSNLRARHFAPVCQKAGITGLKIHGLRHSMATIALADGLPNKVVAERLGHSTVRMTLDRYAHVAPSLQREAAESIDSLLRGRK